ncbi:KAP family P-loop NTPase fold protein [Metallibacterium scheffleri]
MTYRIAELEVPADNPFQHDALERRPLVEFLVGLMERTGGPFVLALDSSWGSGKTTLVRMLEAELRRQEYSCIYFNAWKVDYVTDPLVALVSSIDRLDIGSGEAATSFREHLKSARRVTGLVAKRVAVAAAKALTAGVLDVDEEIEAAVSELAGDSVNDIVEAFQKEGELLEKFRGELEQAIGQLPPAGKKSTLVFFVDELDRCRPTFAIELLERIKHLFDVRNMLFVLSLDKGQLEASVAAVYGPGINAAEYLRRFIDLEYAIPATKAKKFVANLFTRFELDDIFAQRTHPDLRYDRTNLIDLFAALADAVPLSLRAQERCMTRLRVVMDQTPQNHYLDPVLVPVLIVLRTIKPDLFAGLAIGHASAKDVMAYLNGLPGGRQIVTSRSGILIEAYLIAADENEDRKESTLRELQATTQNESTAIAARAGELLEMVQHLRRHMSGTPTLSRVTRKIDLAAGIRE